MSQVDDTIFLLTAPFWAATRNVRRFDTNAEISSGRAACWRRPKVLYTKLLIHAEITFKLQGSPVADSGRELLGIARGETDSSPNVGFDFAPAFIIEPVLDQVSVIASEGRHSIRSQ